MIKSKLITVITLMSLLAGCDHSDSSDGVPVASAGADKSVNESSLVPLSGTAFGTAFADGSSAVYSWAQTSGTPVTIADNSAASINFDAPDVSADETLNFTLTVTADNGQTATDDVNVMVTNVPVAPVTAAGDDQNIDEGTAVTLTATGTSDDGAITGYSWVQTAGTTVTLTGAETESASFTALDVDLDTVLTFKLTITDSNDQTATDSVDITVADVPIPLVATASDDLSADENTLVTLTGSGVSTGTVTGYGWVQTAGTPTIALTDPNSATASFTAPAVAADTVLTFELTVTDSNNVTATDPVAVTVTNVPVGPVANAGVDLSAEEATLVTLAGTGSSTDGTITGYSWVQIGTPAVTLTDADTATATFTAPDVDSDTELTFELTVTDSTGADHTDAVAVTVTNVIVPDAPLFEANLKLWLPFEATSLTTSLKQHQAEQTGITVTNLAETKLLTADYTGTDANSTANVAGKSGRALNLVAAIANAPDAAGDIKSGSKIHITTADLWASTDNFTVSFWFKFFESSTFSKMTFGHQNPDGTFVSKGTKKTGPGHFGVEGGSSDGQITGFHSLGGIRRPDTDGFFEYGQWVFFTATYVDDGNGSNTGTFTLYKNGIETSHTVIAAGESLPWNYIEIANKGAIDDLRMYDRGINSTEVLELFDSYDTFDSDADGILDKDDATPFGDDFTVVE